MDILMETLREGTIGAFETIWNITKIVMPLMIVMTFLRRYNALDFIGKIFRPLSKIFKISENSIFPMTVGLIIGISYGAGVIIDSKEKGDIDLKSAVIISVFLGACHAVIEDTLLFVAEGANGIFVLICRIVVAFILAFFVSIAINGKDITNLCNEEVDVL